MQLKIWEEKAQARAEERTKHRAALETELRALRAAQEEQAAKFDDSLTALQTASAATCAISPGEGGWGLARGVSSQPPYMGRLDWMGPGWTNVT